jgi:hypothetical protein
MKLSIQRSVQPTLPFGPMMLPILVDCRAGARCSIPPDDKPGTLAVPGAPIPPGCIVVVIPPEIANQMRPAIQAAKAKGAELAFLTVANERLYLYADMPQGGQPTFTEGLAPTGPMMATHPVPKGAMLVVLLPELAAKVRPAVKLAIEEARRAEAAGSNGHVV